MKLEGVRNSLIAVILLSVFSSLSHAACWERKEYREIEGFSELENKLILSFKDAVTCEAMEGATVKLGRREYKTDLNGYVSLSMMPFIEIGNANIPMMVSKSGYTTIKTHLRVAATTILNKRMLLSPTLAGNSMRFILQWNEQPRDLDLHLEGNGFHVSYRNMKAGGEAKLDQDEQNGFGPETITVHNIKAEQNYKLSVVNYSAERGMDESAKVLVYVGDHLDSIIPLNQTSKRQVNVLNISNGNIKKLQADNASAQSNVLPGW